MVLAEGTILSGFYRRGCISLGQVNLRLDCLPRRGPDPWTRQSPVLPRRLTHEFVPPSIFPKSRAHFQVECARGPLRVSAQVVALTCPSNYCCFHEGWRGGFFHYFFRSLLYFCARLTRHPAPQRLNGRARFLQHLDGLDEGFRPTLSFS